MCVYILPQSTLSILNIFGSSEYASGYYLAGKDDLTISTSNYFFLI